MCVVTDVGTTIIGLIHFLVNQRTLHDPVVLNVADLWNAAKMNPSKSFLVAAITPIVTAATIGAPYCVDRAMEEGENPTRS
jgi:hypothetical protein